MSICDILSPLGYPVVHPPYRGTERKYITYQSTGQREIIYAEGEEAETACSFGVDLYSDAPPFSSDIISIKGLLQSAGYSSTVETTLYEADTQMWHIAMVAEAEGEIYE